MDPQTLVRLNEGVARAAAKGGRESVVFVDGTAFVVSVRNRTVSYVAEDGTTGSGVVERVSLTTDGPRLTVGGVEGIDPDTLTEVR
jgi:hypothetical protein